MYPVKPIFPYIAGKYTIMPPGLPSRFYPTEESRIHKTSDYVICFDEGVSDEQKSRFIKEYSDYYAKEKASGIFH